MWTRTKSPILLPDYTKEAISRLTGAGFVAYLVGGSVRDFLLGRALKDYDLVTDAKPEEILKLFPEGLKVGLQFGVVKVPVSSGLIEIATFRRDLEYKDHRHPSGVKFGSVEEDAKRRDFTVNAFYYNPKTQSVLDLVDGGKDLEAKIIRAIGDPVERFQEDALRLIRGIRFAVNLGFAIEESTWKAIQKCSQLSKKLSAERVIEELNLILKGPDPAQGMRRLEESGILKEWIYELGETKRVNQSPALQTIEPIWEHTLKMLTLLAKEYPARSTVLSWGVLLRDIGKPRAAQRSGGHNFNGYEIDGSTIAKDILRRLRLTNDEQAQILALIQEHIKFKDVFQMREATLQRWIRQPFFPELMKLHRIDALSSDGNLAFYEFAKSRYDAYLSQPEIPKLIDGNDLIQLGFSPGPEFTSILNSVEDLTVEGKLRTKSEVLEYVIKNFVK